MRDQPSPLLSACLIVRDEAAMLPGCLESLAGIADEVVVVDTGSSDGTPEVARRAGARVSHFAWCDDFAAARNAALAEARGRWILQIDADERLRGPGGMPVDGPALRRFLASPPAEVLRLEAVHLRLHNPLGGDLVEVVPLLRLFLRQPARCYAGRIHETIFASLAAAGLVDRAWVLPDVELLHLGAATELQPAKHRRNLRLCALAVAEHPEDAALHYYYGFELARAAQTGEAAAQMREAWDRMPGWMVGSALWWQTVLRGGELLNMAGCAEEVLARLGPVLERHPTVGHLYFLRGEALRCLGRLEEALACLQAGVGLPRAGLDWEPVNTGPYLCNAIGLVHEQAGRPDLALQAYRRSLALGRSQCAEARLAVLTAGGAGVGGQRVGG